MDATPAAPSDAKLAAMPDSGVGTDGIALGRRMFNVTFRTAVFCTAGRERYENFVEALGRRLAKGQSLRRDLVEDV